MNAPKLRNIGPKSAAWLRQVGVRSIEDVAAVGAVGAFVKVRRAGFKPSLNLLYALEAALLGCHWQGVPLARRQQLLAECQAAIAQLPPPRGARAAMLPGEARVFTHADADADASEDGERTQEIRFGHEHE